jgi:hypothetical protein
VVLAPHVPHHVVEVRALLPAGALGDRDDLCVGLLVTRVMTLPREAGTLARGQRGRPPETRRGGRGHEAVAGGAPIVIARLESPPPRLVM